MMSSTPAYPRPPQGDSWFAPVSVDMLAKVLKATFFHPFIAWLIPICFRAEMMDYEATPMRVSIVYATFISLCWIATTINNRIAYGARREVDLGEEVIVITGGSSGLGLLIAEVYGMRGATVAVLDSLEMENGDARGVTFYECDVSDRKQVEKVAQEIEKDLGTPTILINNAAVVNGKLLLQSKIEDIERTINTNILGHFYTLKTFLPPMIRGGNGGTIVTVSSVIGQLGSAQLTDYSASKAAATALHKSLTAELAQTNPEIKTVLVAPGQLSTPLFYGLQTPSSFFAPVVEPVDIAREVVSAIDNGKGGFIAMPLYARWIDWYNVLPASIQRLARAVSGVDTAMRSFVGREGSPMANTEKEKFVAF
ncbi:short-chain dehydrogenase reductase [Zalerion maritima]|uniref:Short-chain dehydrogenase reductase n=1 Tax=Zalerion maritima TaxID=339359 RepID=A0AAD5RIA6_9PEZI|nr:short-chain dehydrogenase reductase [Zalerion maritima]